MNPDRHPGRGMLGHFFYSSTPDMKWVGRMKVLLVASYIEVGDSYVTCAAAVLPYRSK